MMTKRGFTLIELLIVVAIIAILAAIAVPNFLEAQTRSKVSRVKSDMRSCAVAMECYRVDNNRYIPLCGNPPAYAPELDPPQQLSMTMDYASEGSNVYGTVAYACHLTTPISYIASIPIDPFTSAYHKIFNGAGEAQSGSFANFGWIWTVESKSMKLTVPIPSGTYKGWNPFTDMKWTFVDMGYLYQSAGPNHIIWGADTSSMYDPTNGTVSPGDIWYSPKTNFMDKK